jgi:transposase
MEATGHARWFERLLRELGFELWVGDPARIRAKQVKKQKNDRQDAQHLLKLLLKDDFPRIWVPTPENRDGRQLLLHRHRLVQMRTRVMNQLQAVAMNEGKRGLWTKQGRAELESLSLPTWTSRRRQELLELLDRFDPSIDQLSQAIEHEAEQQPEVQRLMTHPGVVPITALAFVLVLGTPQRFGCGKQVASYLGLVPAEDSDIVVGWATSPNRAIHCFGTCWGRPHKAWPILTKSGGGSTRSWPARDVAGCEVNHRNA